jgi:hypothetical protein
LASDFGPKDPLTRIPVLYHFTDRRNLPLIKKLGGLYPLAILKEKGITVPAPGGNEWSHDADAMKGMDAYVHLGFKSNHPMEYRARQDGRIVDSIFLQVHPAVLQWDDVRFTPEVSNKSGVPLHTITEARSLIDFDVLYTRTNWSDPAIQARLQQAERSEILVPRFIPMALIRNFPDG